MTNFVDLFDSSRHLKPVEHQNYVLSSLPARAAELGARVWKPGDPIASEGQILEDREKVIQKFQVGASGFLRLWTDELPATASFAPDEVIGTPPLTNGDRKARVAAAEFHRLLGPRHEYGLLGASASIGTEEFRMRVNTLRPPEKPLDVAEATCCGPLVGIAAEYADPITQGVGRALAQRSLNADITFVCGAHSLVHSSPRVFGALARLLSSMLLLNVSAATAEAEFRKELGISSK